MKKNTDTSVLLLLANEAGYDEICPKVGDGPHQAAF